MIEETLLCQLCVPDLATLGVHRAAISMATLVSGSRTEQGRQYGGEGAIVDRCPRR